MSRDKIVEEYEKETGNKFNIECIVYNDYAKWLEDRAIKLRERQKHNSKALHIGIVNGSFHIDDVRASIQNALHEQGIGLFKCISVCDNVLKHLEDNGMIIRNDRNINQKKLKIK